MLIDEFDYVLDKKLIAQHPYQERHKSRMMVLSKQKEEIIHSFFFNITEYINSRYVVVFNDTKVFPARFYAHTDNNKLIEILLVKELSEGVWEILAKPLDKLRKCKLLYFSDNIHTASLIKYEYGSRPIIEFLPKNDLWQFIEKYGKTPLPPYIKRLPDEINQDDIYRYQTVYAKTIGSIAAPTAGFHFTPEILANLHQKDIQIISLTLHVGPATFQPLRVNKIEDHHMEPEYYEISCESFYAIKNAKASGKKILAIGTTSTRTLESIDFSKDIEQPIQGSTNLFIYPGFQFKVADALLTNFHLPRSTLLLLVCAFATKAKIFHAYKAAIENHYRFYSYGDCMLIL